MLILTGGNISRHFRVYAHCAVLEAVDNTAINSVESDILSPDGCSPLMYVYLLAPIISYYELYELPFWERKKFRISACMHWRRKWQPTPVFLPRESRDRGVWWNAVYGLAQCRTWLKWLSSSSSSSNLILILKTNQQQNNYPKLLFVWGDGCNTTFCDFSPNKVEWCFSVHRLPLGTH